MINTEKVRLMTKMAVYEKKQGQEDMALAKYYKADYVRFQILKTVLANTFGYVLILVMLMVYHSQFLIENALILRYRMLATQILGYYLLIMVVYVAAVLIAYGIKFQHSRERLSRYYKNLGKLRKLHEEDERMRELMEDDK